MSREAEKGYAKKMRHRDLLPPVRGRYCSSRRTSDAGYANVSAET